MDTQNLPVNRKRHIAVARLMDRMADDLELEVLAGYQGMGRPVLISDVNRPGLALAGYLEYFANDRVQILGNTETHYMERLTASELSARLAAMFSFEVPAFILSRKLEPRPIFLDMCNRRGIPVLRSSRRTDEVISRIILFLAEEFSPETVLHGTAVDCYGVGVVIVGPPGIGKSETALELIERGHRLVADDVVTLRRRREDHLYAETNPVIEHHMEIRGVGIIDVKSIFGVGCVRNSKRIGIIVELEEWRQDIDYDRTGLMEEHVELIGVRVNHMRIPVRPGRNIAIIIEVASLNHRLKELGVHPAAAFNERLIQIMDTGGA
ncbi:MAG TPA: HPr(Ser) kinase/phosphatase [Candidatus Hydrogenedentes bacterium]|nr:HPr(Ser) kinase/phosphatase [Candidatus Hydrogenedentota bacterium]